MEKTSEHRLQTIVSHMIVTAQAHLIQEGNINVQRDMIFWAKVSHFWFVLFFFSYDCYCSNTFNSRDMILFSFSSSSFLPAFIFLRSYVFSSSLFSFFYYFSFLIFLGIVHLFQWKEHHITHTIWIHSHVSYLFFKVTKNAYPSAQSQHCKYKRSHKSSSLCFLSFHSHLLFLLSRFCSLSLISFVVCLLVSPFPLLAFLLSFPILRGF